MKSALVRAAFACCVLIICAPVMAQYKYVGPDGRITYSDTPPPPSAKNVEQKDFSASAGPSTAGLPFELTKIVQNFPVTLYTAEKCSPCAEARTFLRTRGIPFSEKSIVTRDDQAVLQKLSPGNVLPVLLVGAKKTTSFSAVSWNEMLDFAGYPATSQLPSTYRQPPAQPAAPPASKTASDSDADKSSEPVGLLPSNSPPGFRF